jgi:DNA-binding response OmpR family regulator
MMTMTNYEQVGDRTGTRSPRGRVLLVEDDALVRGALEILLSERLDVVAVSSAEAALDGFVAGRYDVLVTDLGLPGRQGDELRRAL